MDDLQIQLSILKDLSESDKFVCIRCKKIFNNDVGVSQCPFCCIIGSNCCCKSYDVCSHKKCRSCRIDVD